MHGGKSAFFKLIGLLMAVCLIFPLSRGVFTAEGASGSTTVEQDKKEITKLQGDLKSIASKKQQMEKDISDTRSSMASQLTLKNKLDEQISLLETEVDLTASLIADYDDEIAKKSVEISQKEQEYNDNYGLFLDFIRYAYEEGNDSYLNVLIGSKNFGDFLSRMDIIGDVLDYQKGVVDNLKQSKDSLEAMMAEFQATKAAQSDYKHDLDVKTADLAQKRADANNTITLLKSNERQLVQSYNDQVAAQEQMQSEISRITKEMQAKQNAQKYVGGAMLFPCNPKYPGNPISSGFGMRTDPFSGKPAMHTGIDIPAAYGSDVYAANDGTVIIAQYNGGYGNCTVIDHGGGITTLYGHASKLLTKPGDVVKRGQVIAKVGSTGASTGNHVHFEVSVNGARQDPLKYLTP